MFKGSICALITPFSAGRVDEAALEALVDWHIAQGTHGLVPCGTTGESPTLSHEEHHRVVEIVVKTAAGRVPVMAGAGSNATQEAISLARHGAKTGADAVLVVTPYYNKPNQEGLYQHFKAVNDAVDIPIYIYNIPPRSIIDMSVETMARLAKLSNIVGVKDATMDLTRPTNCRESIGEDFIQLSGEDGTALAFMVAGGHGCISVTANVAPAKCAAFQNACLEGDYVRARDLHEELMPLHRDLFAEPNPAPAKFALAQMGKINNELRLPLVPVSEDTGKRVRAAMQASGVL